MRKPESSVKEINLRRMVKIILPAMLGLICLYYILTGFDWSGIWQVLQTARILHFLLSSILTTLGFWLLRTLRWLFLLRDENLRISFSKLYLYTAVTVGFANFTPFQSGEALKVEFFRKYGGRRFSGYSALIVEKLLDLLVIASLAFLGIFLLFEPDIISHIQNILIGLIIILILLTILILFLRRSWPKSLPLFERNALPDLKTFVISFAVTLASWLVMIAGWKYMLQSIAVDLTFVQTSSIISLTTIIGILSLVPGAVGVSEISIAALLSKLGYQASTAQAGAVIMGVYSIVVLLLAIIHLIILKLVDYNDKG